MLVTSFTSFVLVVITAISGHSSTATAECTYPGSPFHLHEKKNSIESPGFPSQYYGNEECDWYLNPPRGDFPELLVMDLVVETNVDGIPDAQNVCHSAKNYLNIAHARACGKEGPICVVFMLRTSGDFSCHRTVMDYFSHCTNVLTTSWPTKVTFKTVEPDTKMGFQMNYTFVECGANLDQKEQKAVSTTEASVEQGNATVNGTTNTANSTAPNTKQTAMSSTTSTTVSNTKSTTERKPITKPKFEPTNQPKTTTLKSVKETQEPEPQNTNLILTIVLVLVCVLFCAIVIAVIFRKRIRAWVNEKPPRSSTTQSGSNASYVDTYVIPLEKACTYEKPIQLTVSQPYRSPSTSTDSSSSSAYNEPNKTHSGKKNENNNCAGTIENFAHDTIQM